MSKVFQKTPVTVITGDLGAGKTSLLNNLLVNNKGKKLAVIVNEFGEIGIDSDLVIRSDEEILEMNNGCICCNIRGDLVRIIEKIIRDFHETEHIIIETTGLADPAPIIQSFWVEETLIKNTKLDGLITVVDSLHFNRKKDFLHVKKQISFADVILLNKTDLITFEEQQNIEKDLSMLNPLAILLKTMFSTSNENLFEIGGFDLANALKLDPLFLVSSQHKHQKDINAVCIKNNQVVDGDLFNKWIYKLAQYNGKNLFRYKGIINLDNEARRFVFQGVHMTLDGRPGKPWKKKEKRLNQLVFIGKNLDDHEIEEGFNSCIQSI